MLRPRLVRPKPKASTQLFPVEVPEELVAAVQDHVADYIRLKDRERAGEVRLHGFVCPGKPFRHLTSVDTHGAAEPRQ